MPFFGFQQFRRGEVAPVQAQGMTPVLEKAYSGTYRSPINEDYWYDWNLKPFKQKFKALPTQPTSIGKACTFCFSYFPPIHIYIYISSFFYHLFKDYSSSRISSSNTLFHFLFSHSCKEFSILVFGEITLT